MLGQIIINDKGSLDDFNFIIEDINIGNPTPNIITATVPYMNGYYDFSEITGELTYSNREIIAKFKYKEYEAFISNLNSIYLGFINWLYQAGEIKVSWIKGYFEGRVTSISELSLLEDERVIEVTFLCQPFRILKEEKVELNIENTLTLSLLNSGTRKTYLSARANSNMKIISASKEYSLEANKETKLFKLDIEANNITIQGAGEINLIWKELAI